MKTITLILVGWIIFLSCDNPVNRNISTKDTTGSSDLNIKKDSMKKNITWKKLFSGNQCNIEKIWNLVITDQSQFDSVWSEAFGTDNPHEKPAIDFTKKSVIALFLGTVNSGGHSVEIISISDDYQVTAEHRLPGKSCIATTAIEFPYYFALTDLAISGKTSFTINKKEVECE